MVSEGITSLSSAFIHCGMLTAVHLPSTLRTMTGAFYGCTALATLDIPDAVTEIGESCFYDCANLVSVTWPSSLTQIGRMAFSESHIASVALPPSCKTIEEFAFDSCANLSELSLGCCESLGKSAFKSCTGLKHLTLPESLTNVSQSAFANCTGLECVEFPSSLKVIESSAFDGCSSLEEIAFPEGVEEVRAGAFDKCTNVKKVVIPLSVKSIGTYAFSSVNPYELTCGSSWSAVGLDNVTNCTLLAGITEFNGLKYATRAAKNVQRIELPDTVTSIGNSAFSGSIYTNLSEIILPKTISSVGNGAFYGCDKLTNFPLLDANVTNWGESVYCGCAKVEKLVVPGNMKTIPANTFKNCTGLKSLVIEDGVETVSGNAFTGDDNIESVYIGSTVTNLKFSSYSGPDASKVKTATFCQLHPPKYVVKAFLRNFSGIVYYPPQYASEWADVLDDAGIVNHKPWSAITESDMGEVPVGDVDVPYAWLAKYGLLKEVAPDVVGKMCSGKKDGEGRALAVCDDYISGTNPTNLQDVFTALITFDNGVPIISWHPKLTDAEESMRDYVTYGKMNLADEDWLVVSEETMSGYKFFKVSVEMK